MSRRQAATGLATGLALIIAAPLVWWVSQPEPAGQTVTSVNAAAAAGLASPPLMTSGAAGVAGASPAATSSTAPDITAAPDTSAPSTSAPDDSAIPSEPAVPPPADTSPAGTSDTAPAEPAPAASAPVRIELPALGVDTVVVPVGVDSEGEMEVPQDVSTVGWYRFGPAPGAVAGSAVLSGHVDDYRQGAGVFARIGDLAPGDLVRVVDDTGVSRDFTVLSREEWSKGEVPLDRLFDRGGSSRLVLITCGGSFNNSTLGYDDNIAITAVPVGP